MKAGLLDFVFDVATSVETKVGEDDGKDVLEVVRGEYTWFVGVNLLVPAPRDVEGRTIEMCTVIGGIDIAVPESPDILPCAGDAGDDGTVEWEVLILESGDETTADLVEKIVCLGDEVGDGVTEGIDMDPVVAGHFTELAEDVVEGFA